MNFNSERGQVNSEKHLKNNELSYGVSGSNIWNESYEFSDLDFFKCMTKSKKLKILCTVVYFECFKIHAKMN